MELIDLARKVDEIHSQMTSIKKGQESMQKEVSELYTAFTGNELGQTGIISRVELLEKQLEEHSKLKAKVIGIVIGATTVWSLIFEYLKSKLNIH